MQPGILNLHSRILPAFRFRQESGLVPRDGFSDLTWSLETAEVFDCRRLPTDFIDDTGAASFDEMEALKCRVALPYNTIYLEFSDDMSVLASCVGYGDTDGIDHKVIEIVTLPNEIERLRDDLLLGNVVGEFRNGMPFPNGYGGAMPFFANVFCDISDSANTEYLENLNQFGARRVLAILNLLSDKFISSAFCDDPAPRLTNAREKRGKPRITSPSHVLTLNIAALRRASKKPEGTHESPCLHWRRGHWRVLHRGSEFEDKTWVRKCLVGDPAKGFVRKQYRLVHQVPMIVAENPLMPELIGA